MIRNIALLIVVQLGSVGLMAGDSFSIFFPEKEDRQLVRVAVNVEGDAVSVGPALALDLSFQPRGMALGPEGAYLVVNGMQKDATPVATVELLGDGEMRLASSATLDALGGYSSVDRTGRFFLMANYRYGAVSVHGIDDQGTLGDKVWSLEEPKRTAHCILTTPDNRFVYVGCVKDDNALYQFAFDEGTGQLSPLEPFDAEPPAVFGPRHVAYHPTLPLAYFSNEQQLGVSVYAIGEDGQLEERQHATTRARPSPFVAGRQSMFASDLVLSPDGTLLFVAVRDFVGDEDCVFGFRVEADGRLTFASQTSVGDIPWKLAIAPSGKHLVVSESRANRLGVFRIGSGCELSRVASIETSSGVWDMEVKGVPSRGIK